MFKTVNNLPTHSIQFLSSRTHTISDHFIHSFTINTPNSLASIAFMNKLTTSSTFKYLI